MSEETNTTRPNAVDLKNHRDQTHSDERGLFAGNVVSLEPVRVQVADKLSRALLLKHLENSLELYDCYDPKDEEQYFTETNKVTTGLNLSAIYLPIFATWGYLAMTGYNPLHLSNFVNQFRMIALVGGGTLFALKFLSGAANVVSRNRLSEDKSIIDTKAEIHTHATLLTNYLKYPESDLI
jgi:hypothetical protein